MEGHVAALRQTLDRVREEAVVAEYILEGIEARSLEADEAAGVVAIMPVEVRSRKTFALGALGCYLLLDLLSTKVPGPLSALGIDNHVRILHWANSALVLAHLGFLTN